MPKKLFDDYFLTTLVLNSNIEFRSGKFFYNKKEIKNIDKYIGTLYYNATKKLINEKDLKYLKSGIINNPLSMDVDEWYRPDLIEEAMKLKESGYYPKESPFPLEAKQWIIVYILLFHPEQEVFFITTGIGGSGKSTFLNIIKQLFDDDVASTPLSDLGNPFILAESLKHRLIASDELGTGDVNLPIIKTIVSKQYIQVNEKFGATYTTHAQSSLFFCCNQVPRIDVTDTGMLRRIVYYSRNTKIKNPNPTFKNKKWSKQDLLDFIILASDVDYIYKENDIDSWKEVFKDETNCYLINSNSVGLFVKNCKKNFEPTYEYYNYKSYCLENGYKPFSRQKFDEILEWVKANYIDEEELAKKPVYKLPI